MRGLARALAILCVCTVMGEPAMAAPVPTILANSATGTVTIAKGQPVTLMLGLDASDAAGLPADWWILGVTPFGVYSYYPLLTAWAPGLSAGYQGTLFNIGAFPVQVGTIPVGEYDFYFGVDRQVNGVLNFGTLSARGVHVKVQGANHAPTLMAIADQRLNESTKLTVYLIGSDADGDGLTYSLVSGPGSVSGSTYSWTPAVGASTGNPYSVTVAVSDGRGGGDTETFDVVTIDGPAPEGMVYIPAGSFQMGDSFGELDSDELPVHTLYVSEFYMDRYEVTKALWDEVRAWGLLNGYADLPAGRGKAANHPVFSDINWYDMVKWCNARSQKEGRPACYTVGGVVYKTGQSAPDCDWSAPGYRLPTEAEWEKAARGGLSGQRFPWGANINHDYANYRANGSLDTYDTSPYADYTYHPDYDDGGRPYTSPVGSFPPNGYGLYDIAGNVAEWCWDWHSDSYYGSSPGRDPRGPASGMYRVNRGGSWIQNSQACRVACRIYDFPVNYATTGRAVLNVAVPPGPGANHPPLLTSIADQTVDEGATLTVPLSGSDPDGDELTYSLVSGLGSVSGSTYSYSPDYTASTGSPYSVTVQVSDGRGGEDLVTFDVTVSDDEPPSAPEGMALIPAGSFQMGDNLGDGWGAEELPVHEVYVSAFYMDKYEVTNDKMVEVLNWAYGQGKLVVSASTVKNAEGDQQPLLGLDDSSCRISWNGSQFVLKSAKGSGYPCVNVTWWGAAAYCNYRTLKGGGGRTPCYDFTDWSCNGSANGYRLPTEAEWEKAARGGLSGQRFPWGAEIQHSRANYYSSALCSYDTSPTRHYHPSYDDGEFPYTSPVGSFESGRNGYGLYDMAGNVWEWCSDWYGSSYYDSSPGSDPRGPAQGSFRVIRGGSWTTYPHDCRVAYRCYSYGPVGGYHLGFRAVVPQGPAAAEVSAGR